MSVEREFRDRINAVRSYLRSIEKLEISYTITNRRSYQALATITASRAAAFIMLYNFVEFGVRESVKEVRHAIANSGGDYVGLHDHWREEIARAHFSERLRQGTNHDVLVKQIVDFVPGPLHWNNNDNLLPFAGNVDEKRLFRLVKRLNIRWRPPKGSALYSDLDLIRRMRNDLAHGTETFENIGARFTTRDVIDKSGRVRDFVSSFVRTVYRYQTRQLYQKT